MPALPSSAVPARWRPRRARSGALRAPAAPRGARAGAFRRGTFAFWHGAGSPGAPTCSLRRCAPARRAIRATLLLALLLAAPATGVAQGFRGTVSSTLTYAELKPLVRDTIPRELVDALPGGEYRYRGLPAECEGARCVVLRAGETAHGVASVSDVDVTAWGFGVTGLSATFLVRHRSHVTGAYRPPRADDGVEPVLAYAELVRGAFRVRAGRQRELSGLGLAGFDGVDVLVEPGRSFRAQLFGGRSLARAVQQPLSRAFRAMDERDMIADRDAWLVGGLVGVESAGGGSALELRYQGEFWEDRAGLLSERALLTGRTTALGRTALTASAEYDVGLDRLGRAHLEVQLPAASGRLRITARARRYVPFFEYWTIWGAFSPVAFHEAELRVGFGARPGLALWGLGAYRVYDDHHAQTYLEPLTGRAFRLGGGGDLEVSDGVRLSLGVNAEGPVGAFAVSGDAALDWRISRRAAVAAYATALEQIEEFRVGSGVVAGGGLAASATIAGGIRAAGGIELYHQTQRDRPGRMDWTQRRGWLSVQVELGRDPGLAAAEAP